MKLGSKTPALMIAILAAGIAPGSVFAMNWEGHEDWMADMPHAIELQAATPETNLPADDYKDCQQTLPGNPYEQIPLKLRKCRAVPGAVGK